MISNVSNPNKFQLIKNLQSLRNPIIETIEVFSKDDISNITKTVNDNLRKSPVSVIIVRER